MVTALLRAAQQLVQALFSALLRTPFAQPAVLPAKDSDHPPVAVVLPPAAIMSQPAPAATPSSKSAALNGSHAPAEEAGKIAGEQPGADGALLVEAGGVTMSLSAALESLLFVADKPVGPEQLARALRLPVEIVEAGLRRLADELAHGGRGMRLQVQQEKVRLVTRPDAAAAIEEFLNLDLTTRLSGPALETLAVIAYRQPVTRAQIEAVRGVDCGGVLRTLGQRGLVEEVGRLEAVGRPILYGITEQFMHHFGIMNLDELPPLEAGDRDLLAAVDPLPSHEERPA